MPGEKPFLCSICFQPIELAKCKIDDSGRAVHETCHEQMMLHTAIKKLPATKVKFWGTKRRAG
jgi:hypothetical protein